MNTLPLDRPDVKPVDPPRRSGSQAVWLRILAAVVAMMIVAVATACSSPTDSQATTGSGMAVLVFVVVLVAAWASALMVANLIRWLATEVLPRLIHIAVMAGIAAAAALAVFIATAT